MPENILIIEEHPELRAALVDWLGIAFSDFRVIASSSYTEAVDQINEIAPRIVVMDFNMTRRNGQNSIRKLKTFTPNSKLVILTLFEDENYRALITAEGADAQVSKQFLGSKLIPIIESLLNGGNVVDIEK